MPIAARLRVLAACAIASSVVSLAAHAGTVTQTNIVSDGAVPAAVTDRTLLNPWGISFAPGGPFWISDAGSGISPVYTGSGAFFFSVTVPPPAGGGPSVPTGQVYNPTGDFRIGGGGPATFIFASARGTISGWNGGAGILAVDRSAHHSSYTGLALVQDPTGNVLLAANFASGQVDAFDKAFNLTRSFRSPGLPTSFAPFNVALLNGNIYVAYARRDPVTHRDAKGAGHGFVDQVKLDGTLVRRIQAHGPLNSPWGLAIAPSSFGNLAGALLVGNLGDGRIHAYSLTTGMLLGALHPPGAHTAPLSIDGLWALQPGNGGSGGDATKLYFTAGPNNEADGLFGSLTYTPGTSEK